MTMILHTILNINLVFKIILEFFFSNKVVRSKTPYKSDFTVKVVSPLKMMSYGLVLKHLFQTTPIQIYTIFFLSFGSK